MSADFLGVYPSGEARRDNHAAQLNDGPTVNSYVLSKSRLIIVSGDAVMLSYRADFVRSSDAATRVRCVSSLWCRHGSAWVNPFSQDTPAGERPHQSLRASASPNRR
ncbi:MAG: nuclear transport factor 2 family protein [Acidimicrobiales bacterium]